MKLSFNIISQSQKGNRSDSEEEKSEKEPAYCHNHVTMEDPAVLSVMDMGYTSPIIKKALTMLLEINGIIADLNMYDVTCLIIFKCKIRTDIQTKII